MKKFSLILGALALMVGFSACNPKEGGEGGGDAKQLYDGFYLVGEATAVADFNSEDIELGYMGAGFNEFTKEKRPGMYEKYVALEANKPFKFILHKAGQDDVVYGGSLEKKKAVAEGGLAEIDVFWGQLAENVEMQVPESGLYHVVLDLNQDGQLTATGGKQIMLVPVSWGIRGGFIDANWNNTVAATSASEFDKKHMVFTFKDVKVSKAGAFKFVQADCWKIHLDMMGQVKCETSLGIENDQLTTYGEKIDINIERGMWDLVLTWDLKGGALGKSFTYAPTKTAEVELPDYSASDLVLVGSAIIDTNAEPDYPNADNGGVAGATGWGWGNMFSLGKPQKEGDVYTWIAEEVELIDQVEEDGNPVEAGFKVRSKSIDAEPYVEIGKNGGNLKVKTAGKYKIVVTIDAAADTQDVVVEYVGDEPLPPAEKHDITITADVPEGWEHCYLWAWGDDGDFFAQWPGEELTITEGQVSYTFTQIEGAVNVIFNAGDGKPQTENLEGIDEDSHIVIADNLKN